ncbi:DDE_3 domain-containing protein [Trichonephila clavipes]|nr:DDE_3 domain-containing protein [Trichonephila clavipes]
MITVYGCGGALVSGTIPPHTVLRPTACTADVIVWGSVAYDSRSTLIVMRGTLTGQRYVDDILRPHVGPFLNGLPGAIFQQDNARPHTARVAQDFLRHFQTLPWPARSPDLSRVEPVWDQLKRQMPSCHYVHDLELAVQDLWAHLPQENIRCLINSCRTVCRHALQLEVVQRAIEVAQYLCRCTLCIRLIVLFLRSSESLICVIMCIKFHFNPMLSSWVAILNVPECISTFVPMKCNLRKTNFLLPHEEKNGGRL